MTVETFVNAVIDKHGFTSEDTLTRAFTSELGPVFVLLEASRNTSEFKTAMSILYNYQPIPEIVHLHVRSKPVITEADFSVKK